MKISESNTHDTVILNIVLVNWYGAVDTRQCLESLESFGERNFVVTVVDNSMNQDGIREICKQFSFVEYVYAESNIGFAAGCNRGFYKYNNDSIRFTLFLNNDTIVTRPFIAEIIGWMNDNPNVGAVSPLINYAHDVAVPWFHGSSIDELTLMTIHRNDLCVSSPTVVPWLTGCAMLVSNQAFNEVAGFDESFFLYYEDVDISLRMRQLGYELYVYPVPAVLHKVSQSSSKVSRVSLYYSVRNKVHVLRRHFPFKVVQGMIPYLKSTLGEIKRGDESLLSKIRSCITVFLACWCGLTCRI